MPKNQVYNLKTFPRPRVPAAAPVNLADNPKRIQQNRSAETCGLSMK